MDAVEIEDDDFLYRRIHPTQVHSETGRVLSSAFKGSDAFELSVDLAKLTSPEAVVEWAKTRKRDCAGVAQFQVKDAKACSQEVRYDPLGEDDPDGPNPAHCLVIGDKEKNPKPTVATRLAGCCKWVYPAERIQANAEE